MVKLNFYVPPSHLEQVKEAIFAAGAGAQGDYNQCCWQTLGKGQFCPLPGSDPYIGEVCQLTQVDEYKVEVLCEESKLLEVISALRLAHPYEEPAFECYSIVDPTEI